MRHHKKKVTLGRVIGPRKALLRSLVESLVLHESMTTTLAKAKAARSVVERLITRAKKNRPVDREFAMSTLYTGKAVKKLFDTIAPRYTERKGGYTRIVKLGLRPNDAGQKAKIEMV